MSKNDFAREIGGLVPYGNEIGQACHMRLPLSQSDVKTCSNVLNSPAAERRLNQEGRPLDAAAGWQIRRLYNAGRVVRRP